MFASGNPTRRCLDPVNKFVRYNEETSPEMCENGTYRCCLDIFHTPEMHRPDRMLPGVDAGLTRVARCEDSSNFQR